MSLGPHKVVDGAPPQPPLYTLFGAAQGAEEADDRWINGVLVRNYPCGPADVYDPCDATINPGTAPDGDQIDPYVVHLEVQCHARHGQVWADIQGQARVAFAAYEYAAFETEFWMGAVIPGNRHLAQPSADEPNGPTATSLRNAIGLLEQAIADSGARGMIHTTAAVGSDLAQAGGATKDGSGRLVTPLGTIVVPGYGYPGSGPDGTDAAQGQAWAYATGIVHARREPQPRVVPDNPSQTLDRATNLINVRVERAYAAGWDGCLHAAVLVDRSKTTF